MYTYYDDCKQTKEKKFYLTIQKKTHITTIFTCQSCLQELLNKYLQNEILFKLHKYIFKQEQKRLATNHYLRQRTLQAEIHTKKITGATKIISIQKIHPLR